MFSISSDTKIRQEIAPAIENESSTELPGPIEVRKIKLNISEAIFFF